MTWEAWEKLLDCPSWLAQQHVGRYVFAAENAEGKTILDVACGVGYGTDLLGKQARLAVGVDNAENSISFARESYPGKSISFIRGDGGSLPFPDDAFDLITSFETIEHLSDPGIFLAEIGRILNPDGVFLCSTPNREHSLGHVDHIREFEPDEFARFLRHYFGSVAIHRQSCRRADWQMLSSRNRGCAIRLRRQWLRRRRALRRRLENTPAGKALLARARKLLRRRESPRLTKQRAAIGREQAGALAPLYLPRPETEEAAPELVANSLMAVCSNPLNFRERVEAALRESWLGKGTSPGISRVPRSRLETERYSEIIKDLISISQKTKWACSRGPLLASRRWEYPWAVEALGSAPSLSVLDAGCSLDPLTPYLALQDCRVVGIDNFSSHDIGWDPRAGIFSGSLTGRAKLKIFRDYCRKILGRDIRYESQDMAATSFPPGSFDRIVCISVLEHLPGYKRRIVLEEWHRLLAEGGEAVVTLDYIHRGRHFDLPGMLADGPFELKGDIELFFPEDGSPAVAGLVLEKSPGWRRKTSFWKELYRRSRTVRNGVDSLFRAGPYYWEKVKRSIGL